MTGLIELAEGRRSMRRLASGQAAAPADFTHSQRLCPPQFDAAAFSRILDQALAAGDVACLQLRLKGQDDAAIMAAAKSLMPICMAHDVAFILNDRADLAAQMGADGVHIGQEDGDYATARRLMGPDRIVGVTCHDSRHLAMEAAEAGADYVAFGAFYPSKTKIAKTKADPDILRWWQAMMTVPCVAIGGITVDNCAPLVAAGADFLAVGAGVWDHPEGAAKAVAAFEATIAQALRPSSRDT